jgi:16S rRNA (guanine(527)-N(7))-methyltransferase RsmG
MDIILGEKDQHTFTEFAQQQQLSEQQKEQFKIYIIELLRWNEKHNLTAITDISEIITYHFHDSLKVREFVHIADYKGIVDVGSGAGFPGIPLKICFPEVSVVLIEVNHKKIQFLEHIITLLSLKGIEVCSLDWRTFLRKTEYEANLFCARASLQPAELIRMFKPSCIYKTAQLIYWASAEWKPGPQEKGFLADEFAYRVGNKKRKFVLLCLNPL